jgi:hypothetical protein
MKFIPDMALSVIPHFEIDLAQAIEDSLQGQAVAYDAVNVDVESGATADPLSMKQQNMDHYAALNHFGVSLAHRRLNSEL